MKTEQRKVRALDLFCGVGGSSWGAREAGVEIVAAFDLWPLAGEAHDTNFPEAEFIPGRLEDHDVDALVKRLGSIDLILASPECTNHSPAKGNKPRCEESKGTAFQVVRFAEAFKPRWLVIENVVNMRKWTRYAEFKTALEKLGYKLQEHVLNAAHFRVAQFRRRLFLLADREQIPPKVTPRKTEPRKIADLVDLNGSYRWTPLRQPNRAKATLERAERGFAAIGAQGVVAAVGFLNDVLCLHSGSAEFATNATPASAANQNYICYCTRERHCSTLINRQIQLTAKTPRDSTSAVRLSALDRE